MNKFKIILLSVFLFIAVAYIFRGPEWPEQKATSPSSYSRDPETIDEALSALAERPWDEKLHEKILPELKGREKLPKFEDFPATEFSNNKNIVVDIDSNPIGRLYRTTIRYSVERAGINFAGKYSIAEWGCGTGCQDGVIVDADTGRVYRLPHPMTSGHEARKGSRLLVQNPLTVGSGWMNDWFKIHYWEWTGKDFKLLGVYKVDIERKEIVAVIDE